MNERNKIQIQVFSEMSEVKMIFGRQRCKWEDSMTYFSD
jgi:hypothetical protein